jgi:hypothetical protein
VTGRKPPRNRTARRVAERDARRLVREREKLAALERGGAPERPIEVPSSAVIEARARTLRCPQCEGEYAILDHQDEEGLRVLSVKCRQCGAARRLWFRIAVKEPN